MLLKNVFFFTFCDIHEGLRCPAHPEFCVGKKSNVFSRGLNDVEVHKHSHASQWGVVLDGEIELTINGNENIFAKGDTYFIPKDVQHSAKIKAGYKDLTLFNQKDRYKAKD